MNVNEDVFNISATIFAVIITMVFILSLIKRILDYRIKNKIADKGIPESIASFILQSDVKEEDSLNVKWFFILAGIGAGLTIVNYTMPLGIHSLAIMSFSVAFSFLGYHLYIARTKKDSKGEK